MPNKKSLLRTWAKQVRKNLKNNSALVEKLMHSEVYKDAQNIMLFYPMKDEVNLLPILEDSTKNFYLPKVDNQSLLCCPYCSGDELTTSCFNTKEPISHPINPDKLDLIIVPALAIDNNNYRLGYGGGFYDRFLQNKSATTLVCIQKELVVATIYPEEFDIPVDIVITD